MTRRRTPVGGYTVPLLTEAQWRVVALLPASNKAIGQKLFVTEDTVKTHLRRAYAATGTSGRHDLLAWAQKQDAA